MKKPYETITVWMDYLSANDVVCASPATVTDVDDPYGVLDDGVF